MIVRIWHGVVPEDKANDYYQYLLNNGVRDSRKIKGNKGVYILRRVVGGKAHFQMMTLWDSYESVKEFAGSEYELSRYFPEDKDYLLELEKYCLHYEVLFHPLSS
jgi:heme-degrading monooxygenase HmoA